MSCVNDYIENMVTLTALAKIYSTEYICNTKVAGLGEILSSENFVVYGITEMTVTCTYQNVPKTVNWGKVLVHKVIY